MQKSINRRAAVTRRAALMENEQPIDPQDPPGFHDATERGEVRSKGGYHQPTAGHTNCPCDRTTGKGAYRDVVVDIDGYTITFYHQSPVVVVTPDNTYIPNNHGYDTSTTKDRIRWALPSGYNIIQRDNDWYVTTPDGERVPYSNGMVIPDDTE